MNSSTMNYEVVDASLNFNNYGLLEVTFISRNFIEYPSALNPNCNLYDDPQKSFRCGAETTKLLPEYTYQSSRSQSNQKYFRCTSLMLQDGSPYFPNEDSRSLTDKDKFRVFNSTSDIDQYGIRHVIFEGIGLIDNKPIYPTALADGRSLEEKTLDAFWGGVESVKTSAQFTRRDERMGWVWKTETVLNADGSPISDKALISTSEDYIDFQYPGKVDITNTYGIELTPGGDVKVNVLRKLYLDKNSVEFSDKPFYIKQYAKAGFYVQFEDEDNPYVRIEGCRGYLAGSAAAGGNTSFAGKDCVGFSSVVSSSISYAEFVSKFKSGLMLSASARLLFVDSEGNNWYLREEIFIK